MAEGTFFEGPESAAKSPLRYAYPVVVAMMRMDGEAQVEDRDAESTAHEYHLTEGRVEEVHEHE